jgi:hypothetical protein
VKILFEERKKIATKRLPFDKLRAQIYELSNSIINILLGKAQGSEKS